MDIFRFTTLLRIGKSIYNSSYLLCPYVLDNQTLNMVNLRLIKRLFFNIQISKYKGLI